MSYGNIKINTSLKPDSSGNITISSINDLSNISISSITDGQALKYNGTNWVNDTSSATKEYIFLGEGATQEYSNSGATDDITGSTPNHIIRIYDSNPINTISGASLTYKDNNSSTNWIIKLSIPSGKYNVIAQTNFEFSATGYLVYNLCSSADGSLTPKAVVGKDNSASSGHEGSPSTVTGYFELSSTTEVFLKIHNGSNIDSVAYQGTSDSGDSTTPHVFPSEHTFLYIEKIG